MDASGTHIRFIEAPPGPITPGPASGGTRGSVLGAGSDRPPRPRLLSPDDRKLLVGLLGVLLAVFALVSSNVAANHSPKPHDLPVGIVGTPALVDAAHAKLARAAPAWR